ncbi:MAG: hypothetical protein HWD59_04920 [Coxiellaceae bacterium]|nr:MAG: hypothetical protein HWD59_04920 [Coxiellaceae bacterium]
MTIEQQKTNGLLNLLSPYQDLLRQVVSQLDPASIYNFALVNKLFYRLIFNADNHLLQKIGWPPILVMKPILMPWHQ